MQRKAGSAGAVSGCERRWPARRAPLRRAGFPCRVPEFTCQVAGCCQVFDALEDYEHHYHTLHRNVCSFCKRTFPSGHLLDTHILEWHDSLFQVLSERQDMVGDQMQAARRLRRAPSSRGEGGVRGSAGGTFLALAARLPGVGA